MYYRCLPDTTRLSASGSVIGVVGGGDVIGQGPISGDLMANRGVVARSGGLFLHKAGRVAHRLVPPLCVPVGNKRDMVDITMERESSGLQNMRGGGMCAFACM